MSDSLLAISIAHPNGTVTHHSDKISMEAACLKEAQAHFTQAFDTCFLAPPLISKLGLLNCDDLPFDAIATGQYQPPVGTDPGTQTLLWHLKWPAEVPDCNLTLTKTLHSDGWKKAKEQTASSLSGAHFGHYKVGTFSNIINSVHTALLAIMLKTGFSYNQWKKGITSEHAIM